MQSEIPVIPHFWILLSNLVTAILAVFTTLKTIQFKQKREPAEVRKIDAETTNIYHGITLETHREIQAVIEKAEVRREAWLLKEDQMRTQIVFWRNKSEEIDGRLADAQEAIWKLESQARLDKLQIDKLTTHRDMLRNILDEKQITYPDWDGK
jgi:hypothetical protein